MEATSALKPIIAKWNIFYILGCIPPPPPPWPLQAECVVYALLEQAVEDKFQ